MAKKPLVKSLKPRTPADMIQEALNGFDSHLVALYVRSSKVPWYRKQGSEAYFPSSIEVAAAAEKILEDLMSEPMTTVAIESGQLIAIRNGMNLGIGFVPVHSENFP